jgi:hypothetical protein
MLEGDIPTRSHRLVLGGLEVRSRLQQPTDPAGLIHLRQKLHIRVLEAGVIVAPCFYLFMPKPGQN